MIPVDYKVLLELVSKLLVTRLHGCLTKRHQPGKIPLLVGLQ